MSKVINGLAYGLPVFGIGLVIVFLLIVFVPLLIPGLL